MGPVYVVERGRGHHKTAFRARSEMRHPAPGQTPNNSQRLYDFLIMKAFGFTVDVSDPH